MGDKRKSKVLAQIYKLAIEAGKKAAGDSRQTEAPAARVTDPKGSAQK
jgi:hypothetical protein